MSADNATAPAPAPANDAACKHWLQSRTLWVNVAAAALAGVESATGVLQPLLPVDVHALIALLLPAINAALRIYTTQGLRL